MNLVELAFIFFSRCDFVRLIPYVPNHMDDSPHALLVIAGPVSVGRRNDGTLAHFGLDRRGRNSELCPRRDADICRFRGIPVCLNAFEHGVVHVLLTVTCKTVPNSKSLENPVTFFDDKSPIWGSAGNGNNQKNMAEKPMYNVYTA
jgi:hypothetical protein